MFALADLNKFYASILRAFIPELEGKPIIVLSNNDGCSICQTKEAEKLGIKMGDKIFEGDKKLIVERNNIAVFSTNFPLIADISLRVKSIMRKFCYSIEDYSIDELFLDFRGFDVKETEQMCRDLVHIIKKGIGLPLSIGVAPTKTLAKTACKFAKKYKGYEGVCIIDNEEKREKALKLTKVEDIWGIGYKYTKKLNKYGVHTAFDLTQKPSAWIRKEMTVVGLRTYMELLGTPCIDMELEAPPKKNIMVSRSFGTNIPDIKTISEALITYECMGASKLRSQQSNAKSLYLFLQTNPFREDLPQYSRSIVMHMPNATNSSIEIARYVREGLKLIYKPGYQYKKAGVMMMNISDSNSVQLNLFDSIDRGKHIRLMETVDKLNNRFGKNTVSLSAQGDRKKWWIKQEKLCPCWTTRWNDLPMAM